MQSLHGIPRVNTDEILREFGDWRNMIDVMTAGKMAVKKIARYMFSCQLLGIVGGYFLLSLKIW